VSVRGLISEVERKKAALSRCQRMVLAEPAQRARRA
jgi:hypothetical protein